MSNGNSNSNSTCIVIFSNSDSSANRNIDNKIGSSMIAELTVILTRM